MGNNQPEIVFAFETKVTLKQREALRIFLAKLCSKEKRPIQYLSIVFCSDDYLLKMNRMHLQHDYFTDIISFDLSDTPDFVNGELYISVDRVRDNAKAFSESVNHELHRVIFHGLLHFCGYNDKTTVQQVVMRKKEAHYLSSYFS